LHAENKIAICEPVNAKYDFNEKSIAKYDSHGYNRHMISFEDIDSRLEAIGKDRAWLAENTPYSATYIRDLMAPKSTRRSERVQQIISDAIEREEAAQRVTVRLPDQLALAPTADEFNAWCRAYKASPSETLKDWAIEELNKAAAAWHASRSKLASVPNSQVITFPEVPMLRAAAGLPILADAEMVQPDRQLGPGRFILELRGESMEPRFKDRQRVILRDKATLKRPVLKYGEFYCFVHEGQACFKQWAKDREGRKVLHSLNPDHLDILADDQTDWIGWFDKADN
jgi:hypothetical protein